MKKALFLVQVAAVAMLVVGCSDSNKASTKSTAALDITPPPAHAQPATPAYTPAPAQPVTIAPVDSAPAVTAAPATPAGSTASAAGGSYTVKKGDTLYSIARNRYGDGKQYTRIVAANPGLNPGTLKVGQQIVIP